MSMEKVKALRDMTGAGMMDCKKALDESSGNIDQAVDWLRKKGMASAGKKAGNITAEGLVGSMIHDNRAVILEVNCETDFVSRNKDFQDLIIDMMKVASSGDISDIKDLGNAKYDSEKTVSEKVTSLISVIGENINPRRYKKIEITDGVLVSYTHNKMTDNLGSIGVILAIESSFEGKDELKALGHQIAMHIAASSPLAINVDGLSQDSIDRERKLATDMAQQSGKPDNIIEKMVEGRMKNFYKESALMDQVFVFDSKKQIKDIIADFEKEKNCKILISDFVYFKVGEGVEKKEHNFAKEVMEQIG